MTKSLTEAAKDILGGNVSSKAASQDSSKKLGGDVPEVVTPNKEPQGDSKPTVTTSETSPPGPTPPGGKESGKKLPVTVAQGTEPSNTANSSKSRKLKDEVHSEEDNNDEIYEEIEIDDLVEDENGNVGKVIGIDEETGEIDVEWLGEASENDEDKEEDKDDEDDEDEDDEKETVKESVFDKITFDLSEDVAAIFNGNDELSDEFKSRVTTVFEAAVKSRVQFYAKELDQVFESKFETELEEAQKAISESVETYLEEAVADWIKENEIAIETNLRTELTEDFINGLRNLFLENYIDVPDAKMDVVEELSLKIEELENKINEQIETNVGLKKALRESKKSEILRKETEGLVEAQRDKIYSLAENVEFKDEEAFEEAISTLKESYFPTTATNKAKVGDTELDDISEEVDADTGKKTETNTVTENAFDPMDRYVKAIKRQI